MTVYSKFTPYVESPTIRTTTQPVSGGIIIDTRTAQGTSFRNVNLRQTTLLPQLNSGENDFSVECLNFGVSTPIDGTTPFVDKSNVSALSYISNPEQFQYDFFVGDYLPKNGVLEPLVIRDAATLNTIESPISHRVRGSIMCGNEDNSNGSDLKGSSFLYKKNNDFVPFEDAVETAAFGTIVIVGFISEAENDKSLPYDDSEIDTRFLTGNSSINAQLLLMTGSYDDDFRPLNSKSSASGFVYSNKEGTDSLAFGGLLR